MPHIHNIFASRKCPWEPEAHTWSHLIISTITRADLRGKQDAARRTRPRVLGGFWGRVAGCVYHACVYPDACEDVSVFRSVFLVSVSVSMSVGARVGDKRIKQHNLSA